MAQLEALITAEWMTGVIAHRIIKTAKITARLYLFQLEKIGTIPPRDRQNPSAWEAF